MDNNIKKAKQELEKFADILSVSERFSGNIRELGKEGKRLFGKAINNTEKLIVSLSELDEAFAIENYTNKIARLKELQHKSTGYEKEQILRMENEIRSLLSTSRGAKLFDAETIAKNAKAKHEKIVKKSFEDLYDNFAGLARDLSKTLGKSSIGAKLESYLFTKQEKEGIGGVLGKGLGVAATKLGLEGLDKISSTLNMLSGTFTRISLSAGVFITAFKTIGEIIVGVTDLARKFKSLSGSLQFIGGLRSVGDIGAEIQEGVYKRLLSWTELSGTGKYKEIVELIPTVLKDSNMFSRNINENLSDIASQMTEIVKQSAVFNYTIEQAAEQSMRIYSAFGANGLESNFKRLNILSRTQMMGFEEFFGNMGGFESVFNSFGEKMWEVSLKISSSMENFTKKLDKSLIQRSLIGLYSMPISQQLGLSLAMGGMRAYTEMISGKPESYFGTISKLFDMVKKNVSKSPLGIAGISNFISQYFGADVAKRYAYNIDGFRQKFEEALRMRKEDEMNRLIEEAAKENLTQRSLNSIKESVSVLAKIAAYVEDIKNYIILLLSKWSLLKVVGAGVKSSLDYNILSSSKGGGK